MFFIKFELLPSLNSNTVIADISFPQGTTIKNIQEKSEIIQEDLLKANKDLFIEIFTFSLLGSTINTIRYDLLLISYFIVDSIQLQSITK